LSNATNAQSSPNLMRLVIRSATTKRRKSFGFVVIADEKKQINHAMFMWQ
jgi:hypothetical protein